MSRVGSAAQNDVLKRMAGSLKLELAQFREIEGFTKLGFSLDDATKQLLDRGARLTRLLVQNRFCPVSIDKQILFLFSALNSFLDFMPITLVSIYEYNFFLFYDNSIFKRPIQGELKIKKNNINIKLIEFILWYFSASFLKFLFRYYSKEEKKIN